MHSLLAPVYDKAQFVKVCVAAVSPLKGNHDCNYHLCTFACLTSYSIVSLSPHRFLEFCISSQSPKYVAVNKLSRPIPLLCVSSCHVSSTYKWKKLGSVATYPSTPIIYVTEVGLYLCSVKFGTKTAESDLLAVEVRPG